MTTKKINTSEVMAASKFNRFHLLVFLWCVYAIAFDGFDIAIYGIGLPLMMEEFGIALVEAGAVGNYTLVGMMLGAFIFGPLADTIGRKKLLSILSPCTRLKPSVSVVTSTSAEILKSLFLKSGATNP
jgi:AAHS family benzoate transporter-like MFS transporter